MPVIDLGLVIGPPGAAGTGSKGDKGDDGPNIISNSTRCSLTGLLYGTGVMTEGGTGVVTRAIDEAPTAGHTTQLVTSAGVYNFAARSLGTVGIQSGKWADVAFTGSNVRFAVLVATTANGNLGSRSSLSLVTGFGTSSSSRQVSTIVSGSDITITGTAAGFRVNSAGPVYCSAVVLVDTTNSAELIEYQE